MKKVAELLRERRVELKLTLPDISQKTKIPLEQLEHVEKGRWQNFSSLAYLHGIMTKYAHQLGMDVRKVMALLRRELEEKEIKFIRTTKYEEKGRSLSPNLYLYIFLFLFISFFLVQFLVFWQKPVIKLSDVPKTVGVGKPLVLQGEAEPGALIYLNEEKIYQDIDGKFREEIFLKKGLRTVTLKVLGTNGKEVEKTYQVEVK